MVKLKPTIDSQMCGYKIDCLTVLNKHKAKKFPTINFWKASEGPQKIIQCAESVWAHGRFLLYGMYFMRHIMSCVLYARQIMCGVIISCDYKGTLLICCSVLMLQISLVWPVNWFIKTCYLLLAKPAS